jgi:G3E family GTPase
VAAQSFLAEPTLRRCVLLDGLVATVDAPALSTRLSSARGFSTVRGDSGSVVAPWSSTIVLEDLDLLTPRGKSMIIRAVHEAAPLANVATGGSLSVAVGRRIYDPSLANEHHGEALRRGGPVLEFRSALDPRRAYEALQALLDAHPGQLPMVLASLSFTGTADRLVVHGVRAYTENEWLHDAPVGGVSRVLVVGEGVDRVALRREIALVRS